MTSAIKVGSVIWPPPITAPRPFEPPSQHHAPRPSPRTTSRHAEVQAPSPSHLLTLVPIRIFLAAGWLRSGIEKLSDRQWWNGDSLRTFLDAHHSAAVAPLRPIMEGTLRPHAALVALVVMTTELACGVAIGIGRPLRAALRWAVALNVAFILCGQVNPSAFYLVMEMVLLVAIAEGTIGTHQARPSRRTWALAGAFLLAAAVLSREIRTIEPAKVISDPAIMLVFLALIQAVTLILRSVVASAGTKPSLRRNIWSQRVTAWARARPQPQSAAAGERPVGHGASSPNLISDVGWGRSA